MGNPGLDGVGVLLSDRVDFSVLGLFAILFLLGLKVMGAAIRKQAEAREIQYAESKEYASKDWRFRSGSFSGVFWVV